MLKIINRYLNKQPDCVHIDIKFYAVLVRNMIIYLYLYSCNNFKCDLQNNFFKKKQNFLSMTSIIIM